MHEAKVLELLRLVGGLEYLIVTRVDNLFARDSLIEQVNKLEKAIRDDGKCPICGNELDGDICLRCEDSKQEEQDQRAQDHKYPGGEDEL